MSSKPTGGGGRRPAQPTPSSATGNSQSQSQSQRSARGSESQLTAKKPATKDEGSTSGGKGKGKARVEVDEGGEEMESEGDEEDQEADSLLGNLRKAAESFRAKRARKATQQHDEFKKQISDGLSSVRTDIQEGWDEDEAKIEKAMEKLKGLLAPEQQLKADYVKSNADRGLAWNVLGHLYEEGVDAALIATKDEDNAHMTEIENRPNEIKRARKKAIQLAQREIELVHEEQLMITNGHDLIRNWASVLKPHPARFSRSPSLAGGGKRGKGVGGGGTYYPGGTSALKRYQQKKMRGMAKGF